MSGTITLDGSTRAVGKLYEQLRWGRSAEHPGLADSLIVTNYHMGDMLDRLRSLRESRVTALQNRDVEGAALTTPVRPGEETT